MERPRRRIVKYGFARAPGLCRHAQHFSHADFIVTSQVVHAQIDDDGTS